MSTNQRAHQRIRSSRNNATSGQIDDVDELYNDVALVVDERKVYTNSSLLARNSTVFAELLRGCYGNDVVVDSDRLSSPGSSTFGRAEHGTTSASHLQVMVPNQRYKDVKCMVSFLQTTGGKCEKLTAEMAFKLLPMTKEYKMSKLKKKCGKALNDSFESLHSESNQGTIPLSIVFKYLAAADQYSLEPLMDECILECGSKVSESARREIIEDKHISDKVKIKILDGMFDRTKRQYERNLKDIRDQMDGWFEEADRQRIESNEILNKWKADMKEVIKKVLREASDSHKKLTDELEKTRVIDGLNEAVKETRNSVMYGLQGLKEELNYVVQHLKRKNDKEAKSWESLYDSLNYTLQYCMRDIEKFDEKLATTISRQVNVCKMNKLEEALNRNYEMHDNLDKAHAQLQMKDKYMSEASVREKQLEMELEKTKAQLIKHMTKTHQMNTWLKWAKPVEDSEEKCLCFRHAHNRKSVG